MLKTLSGLGIALLLFTQGCTGADPGSSPTPAATTARSEELPRDVASVDLTEDQPLSDTVERQMPWTGDGDERVASLSQSKTGLSDGTELALKIQRGHQAEQELAELAILNSKNAGVREAAQMIFEDHETAENMLRKAAGSELPRIPELTLEQDKLKEKLGELQGAEFDRAFLAAMVEDHEKELTLYREQTGKAPTAELRGYFRSVTPVLEKHLTHCRELLATLKVR